jgi:hypothetical protein
LLVAPATEAQPASFRYLEVGAANYGGDISRLIESVEDLVSTQGSRIELYLNDVDGEALARAVARLRALARRRGWRDLEVQPLPGRYQEIDLPDVDLAHVGNPVESMLEGPGLSRLLEHTGAVLITTYFHDAMVRFLSTHPRIAYELRGRARRYLDSSGALWNGGIDARGLLTRHGAPLRYLLARDPDQLLRPLPSAPLLRQLSRHLRDAVRPSTLDQAADRLRVRAHLAGRR